MRNSIYFGQFLCVSVQFGPPRAASGESWGVGWGQGGVGGKGGSVREKNITRPGKGGWDFRSLAGIPPCMNSEPEVDADPRPLENPA